MAPKKTKSKVEKEVEAVEETPTETEEEETEEETLSEDSVDILNGDLYVRTFSMEDHGDEWMSLAQEFITKKPKQPKNGQYRIVPSSSVGKVVVNWREKADADLHIDKQKPDAPIVDKSEVFTDKKKALALKVRKFGATVSVSKKK